VVIEHAELTAADRAKVNLLVIIGVLFLEAWFAQKSAGLHFPLPLWLFAAFHDLFADRAPVRCLFLPDHELLCLFDVATAAEQTLNSPLLAGLVLMLPDFFAAYRAIDHLLFAENVQAKVLACTATKMYIGTTTGKGNETPSNPKPPQIAQASAGKSHSR
jgi:hypothetical protein